MKVVILAGGLGTRLAEYTDLIPKPMVTIGGVPILHHIMEIYSKHGYKEFVVACGYKASVIKEYFLNFHTLSSDFTVNMSDGSITFLNRSSRDWKVTLIDTGLNTLTGGRVGRLKEVIGNESFMLTYGDGVSDVNITELVKFHKENKKMVTVTAVRPSARFGEMLIDDKELVKEFKEKPQAEQGWINGGFFVIEPEFFDYITLGDQTILEREPLEAVTQKGELVAYKHSGFWQCMDTVRDRIYLESFCEESVNNAPWLK